MNLSDVARVFTLLEIFYLEHLNVLVEDEKRFRHDIVYVSKQKPCIVQHFILLDMISYACNEWDGGRFNFLLHHLDRRLDSLSVYQLISQLTFRVRKCVFELDYKCGCMDFPLLNNGHQSLLLDKPDPNGDQREYQFGYLFNAVREWRRNLN